MKIRKGTLVFVMMLLGYFTKEVGGLPGVIFVGIALLAGTVVNHFTKGELVDIL